ncbi:hypothetical protein JTE90_013381 [Oedothorax gibbosus]|uniref:Uncharacterized protein n=1 Tax=Oedothorax gibbosus TaxID=931172 RepID=A0AAV6TWX9_9ARAC|nr:hypothetical protein JTE90_013381 [Oedothorax gibbosus]
MLLKENSDSFISMVSPVQEAESSSASNDGLVCVLEDESHVETPSTSAQPPTKAEPTSADWLKRKRRPNASLRAAEALSAAASARRAVVERESSREIELMEIEHQRRMLLIEEQILTERAKRVYYKRENKN